MSLEQPSQQIDKEPNNKEIPQKNPVSNQLNEVFNRRRISIDNFISNTGFHSGPMGASRSYRRALWSFAASIIDTLIVVSIVCFFLVAFALTVKSEMKVILSFFDDSFLLFGEIVFVLLAMTYITFLRSFLGYSVGEWACGLRLGEPKERFSRYYSLRVILRTVVVFFTGLVVLPVLSMITGYDMAGRLSGIYLIELPPR